MTNDITEPNGAFSRRTVLKTAAWAAPVVAVAVAAPFASASSGKLPSDYIVSATITGSIPENAATANDIWVSQGTVTLQGKPGDTSGLLTGYVTVPVHYDAQQSNGGPAFVVGQSYSGWTLSAINGSSRKVYVFNHPSLTIQQGATSATASAFPYFYMKLQSGQTGAPTGDNANSSTSARFRIGAGSVAGGQYAADTFFPALPEDS